MRNVVDGIDGVEVMKRKLRKWRAGREKRREAARRAALARWGGKGQEERPRQAVRVRITVERSWWTREVIEGERVETGEGKWSRWRVAGISRRLGDGGIGRLVAEALRR